jgi:hypothetical protein
MLKSKPESKFRFRHRSFDEISMEFRRNFDFIESQQPKSKFRFRFRRRNRNSGKSKHQNVDKIRVKFRRNFDFAESKQNYFRGHPIRNFDFFLRTSER